MRFPLILAAVLAAVVFLSGGPAAAKVTDEQIQKAIDQGVQFLLNGQDDKGLWSPNGVFRFQASTSDWPAASEALAMGALAYADVSMNDEKMKKGFKTLISLRPINTYVAALRIIALSKLLHRLGREPHELAMKCIKEDVAFLLRVQRPNGSWGYPWRGVDPPPLAAIDLKQGGWDLSNTQIAILGLSEAINAGVEIPPEVLKKAQDLYLSKQEPDGGFTYGVNPGMGPFYVNSYGSMTAAGVASLFITRDYLYRGLGCPCKGDRSGSRPEQVDKAIDGGLAWLGKYFAPDTNPSPVAGNQKTWVLYWLYACERAGLASGIKYFGGHDWYAEGAEALVKSQRAKGDWESMYDTYFAICFLIKGRAPILFNKLMFEGQWNNHPRDIANLAGYVAKQKEQPIQWQIINLQAPVDEWHDAPILYITAESALKFSTEEKKKLRQFTDSGGTILFEASCGNRDAANSWRVLAKEVWPEWEMRLLDKEHPLFVADQKMTSAKLPLLFGMDDGLRTFAFVSFVDISCAWNTLAVAQQLPLFNLGSNLYAYTTDHRPLRSRLAEKKTITKSAYLEAALQVGPKAALKAVRLKHGGDWYVGQNYGAWAHLTREVGGRCPLKLELADPVDAAGLTASGAQIAQLTARQAVTLNDADVASLKKYLEGGGFLLAEAAMGDTRFEGTFRPLAQQLGLQEKALAADDPLIKGAFKGATGYDVSAVKFRYALRTERLGKAVPDLRGLYLGDKLVGVYSPFDLSFTQTGCDAWGCRGYEAEDAMAILTNILLLVSTR
jgi:hypothetical protein